MAGSFSTVRIRDYSLEKSSSSIEGATITAANFDAQIALIDAWQVAMQNIVIGTPEHLSVLAVNDPIAGADPTSPFAQREMKWLVVARENTSGKTHTFQIPTPDLQYLTPGTDIADLTATEIAAFVTAMQNLWRVDGTLQGTVQQIRLIGRNL